MGFLHRMRLVFWFSMMMWPQSFRLRVADDDTKALIRKVIENVRASGRSDGALRAAVPHLVNAEDAVLLMLTDGQPTYRKDGEDPFSFDTDIAVFNSIRVVAVSSIIQSDNPVCSRCFKHLGEICAQRAIRACSSQRTCGLTIAPTIMDLSIEFEGAFPKWFMVRARPITRGRECACCGSIS